MKKRMGRPNGHSPKNPIIRAISEQISEKKAERDRITAELKELHRQLKAFRKVIVKQRRPKKVSKASSTKPKTLGIKLK